MSARVSSNLELLGSLDEGYGEAANGIGNVGGSLSTWREPLLSSTPTPSAMTSLPASPPPPGRLQMSGCDGGDDAAKSIYESIRGSHLRHHLIVTSCSTLLLLQLALYVASYARPWSSTVVQLHSNYKTILQTTLYEGDLGSNLRMFRDSGAVGMWLVMVIFVFVVPMLVGLVVQPTLLLRLCRTWRRIDELEVDVDGGEFSPRATMAGIATVDDVEAEDDGDSGRCCGGTLRSLCAGIPCLVPSCTSLTFFCDRKESMSKSNAALRFLEVSCKTISSVGFVQAVLLEANTVSFKLTEDGIDADILSYTDGGLLSLILAGTIGVLITVLLRARYDCLFSMANGAERASSRRDPSRPVDFAKHDAAGDVTAPRRKERSRAEEEEEAVTAAFDAFELDRTALTPLLMPPRVGCGAGKEDANGSLHHPLMAAEDDDNNEGETEEYPLVTITFAPDDSYATAEGGTCAIHRTHSSDAPPASVQTEPSRQGGRNHSPYWWCGSCWPCCTTLLVYMAAVVATLLWVPLYLNPTPIVRFDYTGVLTTYMASTSKELTLWEITSSIWTDTPNKGFGFVNVVLFGINVVALPILALVLSWYLIVCGKNRGDGNSNQMMAFRALRFTYPFANQSIFALSAVASLQAMERVSRVLFDDSTRLCRILQQHYETDCLVVSGVALPGAWYFVLQALCLEVFVWSTLCRLEATVYVNSDMVRR